MPYILRFIWSIYFLFCLFLTIHISHSLDIVNYVSAWIHFVLQAGGIRLPVLRKLAKMKLDFAELSLEIMHLVIDEESKKLQEEKSKGALCVMVEEFVRATPDYNSVEQVWKLLQLHFVISCLWVHTRGWTCLVWELYTIQIHLIAIVFLKS